MSTVRPYGVVQIGQAYLAVEAGALVQAVHWPADLHPHPVTRGALVGVFSLRGKAMPLIDIRGFLAGGEVPSTPTRLVAVLSYAGGHMAIAIDAVCDIVKAADSQLCPIGTRSGAASLTPHLIVAGHDQRLIYTLDLAYLATLPGVMFAADPGARVHQQSLQAQEKLRLHYLVFECDGQHFCIEASVVTELVNQPDISSSEFGNGLCVGTTMIRGTRVPALGLSQLLGFEIGSAARKSQLLVLTAPDGRMCGFGYDSMVAIQRQAESALLPMPRYGLREPDLLAAVMSLDDGQQALVIDHKALLVRAEVKSYTKVYQHDVTAEQGARQKANVANRQACLLFDAPTQFVAPLSQIAEIMGMPSRLVGLSQPESHLLGQFNLRGEQVPLICLSSLLASVPLETTADTRVLIVRGEHVCFGFAVNRVDQINAFNQFDPKMLGQEHCSSVGKPVSVNDRVRSLVSVGSGDHTWRATFLDLQNIAVQLEQRSVKSAAA